jgi:hypothetical protein
MEITPLSLLLSSSEAFLRTQLAFCCTRLHQGKTLLADT